MTSAYTRVDINTYWLVLFACGCQYKHTNTHTAYLHTALPRLCVPHRQMHTWAGKHRCHRPGGECGCTAAGDGRSWHTPSAKQKQSHRVKPQRNMRKASVYVAGHFLHCPLKYTILLISVPWLPQLIFPCTNWGIDYFKFLIWVCSR